MLRQVHLDYDLSVFLEPKADYSIHKGTCLAHQLSELTDIHKEYGLGQTYDENNTIIQQLWHTPDQVDFIDLGSKLEMEVITVSSILQPPGNVIALHRDTFYQINKKYPNDKRLKVRANIYLEDWKVGHLIQYQDINNNKKWKTSDNWQAGDGFIWSSDVL